VHQIGKDQDQNRIYTVQELRAIAIMFKGMYIHISGFMPSSASNQQAKLSYYQLKIIMFTARGWIHHITQINKGKFTRC
jgi:methanogenic corrinoid protein MtbC1